MLGWILNFLGQVCVGGCWSSRKPADYDEQMKERATAIQAMLNRRGFKG